MIRDDSIKSYFAKSGRFCSTLKFWRGVPVVLIRRALRAGFDFQACDGMEEFWARVRGRLGQPDTREIQALVDALRPHFLDGEVPPPCALRVALLAVFFHPASQNRGKAGYYAGRAIRWRRSVRSVTRRFRSDGRLFDVAVIEAFRGAKSGGSEGPAINLDEVFDATQ